MKINEILESVKSGKISTKDAKKLLTLYSIEEVENFAKIDINRSKRRGVPEVIFAETKELDDIKKIVKKTLEKTNSVPVSRIKKEITKNYFYLSKIKGPSKTGKNSSTICFLKNQLNSKEELWNFDCRYI
ncbi:MAG: hypothetical protein CM1200mP11_3250 [Nitrosopumilaceae archaeon]|nr:MAG: hypothetical protein CM1200mP11_3250 [Nitrosopumilaceae archaeon]